MPKTPQVSIGLPVFDGGLRVGRAIESLLAQTHADFELIVSDNASTDSTEDVVRELALRDPRIRYIRQPTNIGATANFGFVLHEARWPYFMWAADDDRWAPTFIEKNVAFLEANPDFVASISRVEFEDGPPEFVGNMGTHPLVGTVAANIESHLRKLGSGSRFYAVQRTQSVRCAWIKQPYWASDWVFVARLLRAGKYNEIPETLMWRRYWGSSSFDHYAGVRKWARGRLDVLFPIGRATLALLEIPEVRHNPRMLLFLAHLNYGNALEMMKGAIRAGRARRQISKDQLG